MEERAQVKKANTPGKLNSTISVKVTPELKARIGRLKGLGSDVSALMRTAVEDAVLAEELAVAGTLPAGEKPVIQTENSI